MRWTWIDRFVSFESGKAATAVKNLSLAEDHFADHFPGFPVMPAPLILEGLAQTGGILVGEANKYEKNVVLAKMMDAKFHREALAGEQLTYTTTIVDLNDTGARVNATAHSGNELIAEVVIMFAHVTAAQLPPGLPDTKFVFSGELTHLLRAAEAVSKPVPAN
jgi:3-hydroxyacyl-[acyl-carrier-protein] dehydratase